MDIIIYIKIIPKWYKTTIASHVILILNTIKHTNHEKKKKKKMTYEEVWYFKFRIDF